MKLKQASVELFIVCYMVLKIFVALKFKDIFKLCRKSSLNIYCSSCCNKNKIKQPKQAY